MVQVGLVSEVCLTKGEDPGPSTPGGTDSESRHAGNSAPGFLQTVVCQERRERFCCLRLWLVERSIPIGPLSDACCGVERRINLFLLGMLAKPVCDTFDLSCARVNCINQVHDFSISSDHGISRTFKKLDSCD